jgi:hypothetical protein
VPGKYTKITNENARKVLRLFPFVSIVPFVFRPFAVSYGRARMLRLKTGFFG